MKLADAANKWDCGLVEQLLLPSLGVGKEAEPLPLPGYCELGLLLARTSVLGRGRKLTRTGCLVGRTANMSGVGYSSFGLNFNLKFCFNVTF